MMKKCLDEGLMQCYLDGELSPGMMRDATAHIVRCKVCDEAMASARNESGFIAAAFEHKDYLDVPTEHLRSRVNAAISQLESTRAQTKQNTGLNVSALLASLSGIFTHLPRQAVAFASLAVVACAFVFMLIHRQPLSPNEVATNGNQAAVVNPQPTQQPSEIVKSAEQSPTVKVKLNHEREAVYLKASGSNSSRVQRVRFEKAIFVTPRSPETGKLLASENQYRETIAALNKTIAAGGDAVLRPTVRANYERNVAMLDSAIAETRGVALRNPKDKDAVNFLMSAYQSKVELLTTVANQAQVAKLGR